MKCCCGYIEDENIIIKCMVAALDLGHCGDDDDVPLTASYCCGGSKT